MWKVSMYVIMLVIKEYWIFSGVFVKSRNSIQTDCLLISVYKCDVILPEWRHVHVKALLTIQSGLIFLDR